MPIKLYSWSAWTDGKVHVLKRGKHFEKDAEAFAKSVRRYASRHGMVATASRRGDTVWVQFFDAEDEPEQGDES